MTTENVGAIGKTPKLVTEYRAKQLEKQQIDANPAQNAGEKAENSQLNDNFYKSMGVELTTFDENTNESALKAKDKSTDVTDMRQNTRETYRQLLEEELPKLEIEHIKGWFDGTKAIPKTSNRDLDDKLALINKNSELMENVIDKRGHITKQKDAEMITELQKFRKTDEMLAKMLTYSDYDESQKQKLKSELEKTYSMSLEDLSQELYNIKIDTNGLENLNADSKREDIEKQVTILDNILAQISNSDTIEKDMEEIKNYLNIHVGDRNGSVAIMVRRQWAEADEEHEYNKVLGEQLKKDQDADIQGYVKLQKLELLQGSLGNIREEVKKLRDKLDAANTELKQMEEFEENAESKSITLKKSERDEYRNTVINVKNTGIKTAKAASKIGKAEKTDKQKDLYNEKIDTKTASKVSSAASTHETKQKIEDAAKKAKTQAGYYKNFGHVNQYIYDNFKDKKISKEEARELRAALGKYTTADADKLEVLADWVKVDDQSGENIDKKANTKVSIETDLNQLKPEELKFLLETVKDMDMELKTTKQKNEAKEQVAKVLQEHRGIKASQNIQEAEEIEEMEPQQAPKANPQSTVKDDIEDFFNAYEKEIEDPK